MIKDDSRIFFFSLFGLVIFAYLSFNAHPSEVFFAFDKKMGRPEIKAGNLDDQIHLSFPGKEKQKIQLVLLNRETPDTIETKGDLVIPNLIGNNRSIMLASCSPKNRIPLSDGPGALVLAARYIDKNKEKAGAWTYFTRLTSHHSLKVVSILVAPDFLFGFDQGIYVSGQTQLYENTKPAFGQGWWLSAGNWINRGKDWEHQAAFQYLQPDGKILYQDVCGIRINGNATRGFPQKSFKLVAAKKYGHKQFDYPFFATNPYHQYGSLILRNSGNDWGRTQFADFFIQLRLPAGQIDKQEYEPVVLYINGVYWGIYGLCERLDEKYLATKYQVNKKKITILEGNTLDYGDSEIQNEFTQLVRNCEEQDFSKDAAYGTFCKSVDIDNLALYLAIQLYIVNTDLHDLNVKMYRLDAGDDRRWKWMVHDLDCSYSYSGSAAYATDMFTYLQNATGSLGVIFNACMKNHRFRELLRTRIDELLAHAFNKEEQLQQLNVFEKMYATEMQNQVLRWRKPESIDAWKNQVENFRQFIVNREPHLRSQMKKYLEGQ